MGRRQEDDGTLLVRSIFEVVTATYIAPPHSSTQGTRMHRTTLELMRSHVREIHQAVTGRDLPEEAPVNQATGETLSPDGVMRLFNEVEVAARTLPGVADRVPPFSFTPPMDVLESEKQWVVVVAAPGIDREDIDVKVQNDVLVITGSLDRDASINSQRYAHAEIAQGPFQRVVKLPQPVQSEPRVHVERGLIRVEMEKATH
jgi:HSP20 family protein